MAMTKKEREAMEAALRWTAPVERDVRPPKEWDRRSLGWDMNSHSGTVREAWSEINSHGDGHAAKPDIHYYSASQGCRSLYSTKALALAALRHELELKAAASLLAVDRQLAKAKGQESEAKIDG